MKQNKKKIVRRFYLPNGKRLSKTFCRKSDADDWIAKMRSDRIRGNLIDPKDMVKSILFSDLARKWFENNIQSRKARKTVIDYTSCLNAHLLPTFGKSYSDKISSSDIDKFQSQLINSGLKSKTINRVNSVLKQIFSYGIVEMHLNENPIKRSLHRKVSNTKVDYYEEGEVRQLLDANKNERYFPILYTAVHTGMRLGEILGLCWDRVNFISNQIEITRSLSRYALEEKTKTGKSRYFPMTNQLRTLFEELRRNQNNPRFVFTNENGDHYKPDHFCSRELAKACIKANIRKLRFHDLRHSYASHFMMNGGNFLELQKLLGHAKMDTTLIYSHLSPDHLRKAAEIVNFNVGVPWSGPKTDHENVGGKILKVISST